jgi:hypothetical protein
MRAADHDVPQSAIDPDWIVATRVVDARTFHVLDVGDDLYRLAEGGTIMHPRIDPWASNRTPTVRQIRAFLHPRKQAFATVMDQYGIRANDDYQYEDTYEALYGTRRSGDGRPCTATKRTTASSTPAPPRPPATYSPRPSATSTSDCRRRHRSRHRRIPRVPRDGAADPAAATIPRNRTTADPPRRP